MVRPIFADEVGRFNAALREHHWLGHRLTGQVPGVGDKILAIPSGTYINDFAIYGFDHSGDGVSSVVNRTDEDNALFSAADQQGHSLPVDRQGCVKVT